jgi:hypothetical protein
MKNCNMTLLPLPLLKETCSDAAINGHAVPLSNVRCHPECSIFEIAAILNF